MEKEIITQTKIVLTLEEFKIIRHGIACLKDILNTSVHLTPDKLSEKVENIRLTYIESWNNILDKMDKYGLGGEL